MGCHQVKLGNKTRFHSFLKMRPSSKCKLWQPCFTEPLRTEFVIGEKGAEFLFSCWTFYCLSAYKWVQIFIFFFSLPPLKSLETDAPGLNLFRLPHIMKYPLS